MTLTGWTPPTARRQPSYRGKCSRCERRREVYRIGRMGAGAYNRAQRRYSSSICGDCAMVLLAGASTHAMATASSYDVSSLDRIVASLGTEEAAEIFTAFRDRKERARLYREGVYA